MGKPITPYVGSDVFVLNLENKVLLVRRSDNGYWALPGGTQDLNETPKQCAERECVEESGYTARVTELWGVFSSQCYPSVNFPWKENQYCHLLFRAELTGGKPTLSAETTEIGWFGVDELPPLSDGHEVRIRFGFKKAFDSNIPVYFE